MLVIYYCNLKTNNTLNTITNSNSTMPNENTSIDNSNTQPNEVSDAADYYVDIEKVNITVKQDTITPTSVSIVIQNNNENNLTYSEEFKIQEKINETWKDLKYKSGSRLMWNSLLLIVHEHDEATQKLDIETYYGSLPKGIYRVKKSIINANKDAKQSYVCSDEFQID